MKRNIYIKLSLLTLFFGSLLSCSDLEQKPIGLLTPNTAFSTVAEVEKGVFGSYAAFASEHWLGRQYSVGILLRDDMCDVGERNTVPARMEFNDFTISPTNDLIAEFWPQAYLAISAANTAIFGGENLVGVEQEKINPIIAEAKFNKAYAYYHLVRCFGGLPYIDKFIEDPQTVATIAKTPEDKVYEYIIADLQYAKEWLPEKRTPDVRSRATKGTAAAYLASVYLTLGQWQNAYNEAKYVIDNKALFGYDLVPDFKMLWDGPNANGLKEHLFAIDFMAKYGGEPVNVDFLPALTGVRGGVPEGWSICVPSDLAYSTWDDRDYRKKVSFFTEATFLMPNRTLVVQPMSTFGIPRAHINKYYSNAGGTTVPGDTETNYADMRYAEVLLIAAEALNEISGPTAEAQGYVNEVRKRARNWNDGTTHDFPFDVTSGISKDEFRDLVLDDRRLELAFELKRWFDIKRRNLGDKVFKGPNSLEPHPNFDASRDYLIPLPQRELDNYPSFGPQNPGY
jgi:hypothetical protein